MPPELGGQQERTSCDLSSAVDAAGPDAVAAECLIAVFDVERRLLVTGDRGSEHLLAQPRFPIDGDIHATLELEPRVEPLQQHRGVVVGHQTEHGPEELWRLDVRLVYEHHGRDARTAGP